jgi:GDP-D-mannose dehydratase
MTGPGWSGTTRPCFAPPTEPPWSGDAGKAAARLGWKPTVPFAELVERMVRHDLAVESAAAGR